MESFLLLAHFPNQRKPEVTPWSGLRGQETSCGRLPAPAAGLQDSGWTSPSFLFLPSNAGSWYWATTLTLECVLWALHHEWEIGLTCGVTPYRGFVPGTQCDICSNRSCPNHCLPELLLTIPLQPAILRWALPQPCAQPRLWHSTTCITGIPPAVLLRKRAEPTRRTERAGEEAASFCTPAPYSAELPETAGVRMGGGKCHLVLYPELFSPGV